MVLRCLVVELLAGLGVVDEDLGGLELGALGVSPPVHLVDELLGALLVQHAEGAAQERREADAEHSSDVTISGSADDLILQTEGGLVDESGDDSELDLLLGQGGLGHAGLADELLELADHLGVELLLLALLGVLGVQVEALAGLAAQPALVHHRLHHTGVAALHAHAQVRLGHELVHVVRDVAAHLIRESDGADGHAEVLHALVECLEAHALHDQRAHLHGEGRQAAVHEETRHVLHEDGRLALAGTHLHRRSSHLGGSASVGDDLEQGHLGHGGEVVHADHALGSQGTLGDVGDGDGGGIGGEDGVRGQDGLHLLQHLMLHAQLLKDSLDDEVSRGEVSLPGLHVVVQRHQARGGGAELVVGDALLLELGLELVHDHLLAATHALHVLVLQQHLVLAVVHGHLRDAGAHEARAQHSNLLHGLGGLAEVVLLDGGGAVEEADQRSGLGGGGELGEAGSLVLQVGGLGLAEVVLQHVDDVVGSGVLAAGGLINGLLGLVEHDAGQGSLLQGPGHPVSLALGGLDGTVCEALSLGDGHGLEHVGVDHPMYSALI
eukprot:Colp12_sorted_trinity150504_noHs@34773